MRSLLSSRALLRSLSQSPQLRPCRHLQSSTIPHPSGGVPSFVFDIDGVLLRGKQVFPFARKALQSLHDRHGNRKHPIVFMTNGGGFSETERAEQLTNLLDVPVDEEQVVLSHTPMRQYVKKYNEMKGHCVMVIGKGRSKEVAKEYGYERVISSEELGALHKELTPFVDYSKVENGLSEEL